jgi:hypothetical protein
VLQAPPRQYPESLWPTHYRYMVFIPMYLVALFTRFGVVGFAAWASGAASAARREAAELRAAAAEGVGKDGFPLAEGALKKQQLLDSGEVDSSADTAAGAARPSFMQQRLATAAGIFRFTPFKAGAAAAHSLGGAGGTPAPRGRLANTPASRPRVGSVTPEAQFAAEARALSEARSAARSSSGSVAGRQAAEAASSAARLAELQAEGGASPTLGRGAAGSPRASGDRPRSRNGARSGAINSSGGGVRQRQRAVE